MSKFYRRKYNKFQVVKTRFDSLEAGPVVVLQPEDFDVEEVPLGVFLSEFEEVPVNEEGESKAKPEKLDDSRFRLLLAGLQGFINNYDDHWNITLQGPTSHYVVISGELRAILDAARKTLVKLDASADLSASRCRVGEWLPGRYLEQADSLRCLCFMEEAEQVTYQALSPISGTKFVQSVSQEVWDASLSRWIADGRPMS